MSERSEHKSVITAFGEIELDDWGNPAGKMRALPADDSIAAFLPLARGETVQSMPPGADLLEVAGMGRREALQRMRQLAQRTTAELLRTTVGRDYLLMQAVNALDDLNVVINTLSIRLREWWGIHQPELAQKLQDNNEALVKAVIDGKEVSGGVGISLLAEDAQKIVALANRILVLFDEKAELEKYVDYLSAQLAPRLHEVAGGSLAARIIAKAGGMERLAFMPSSTVQVLGAEKALFKHLTRGTPCPKHGLIFQHPSIQSAPRNLRGKIARRLASKMAIAARVDHFSGRTSAD